MRTIVRTDLESLIAAGAVTVVEALPEKYYRTAHLPGAKHMPHDETAALAPGILPDRAAGIVVYCASATCTNSHIAAETLAGLGYTDVRVYVDGKQDWIDAGLPVETGDAASRAA